MSPLKQREQLAQKELRRAQKAMAKAEKAQKEAERKRRLAEAQAARAQSASYCVTGEVERARQAQHWAEAALRKNTRATFTALEQSKLRNTTLPSIESKIASGPSCVLC